MEEKNAKEAVVANGKEETVEDLPYTGILQYPVIRQTIKEDPLLRFLYLQSTQILTVIVVVLAGWFLYGQYQTSRLVAVQDAADEFVGLRNDWTEYNAVITKIADLKKADATKTEKEEKVGETAKAEELKTAEEKLQKVEVRLQEKFKILAEKKSPYRNFGVYYSGLQALKQGKEAEKEVAALQSKRSDKSELAAYLLPDLLSLTAARYQMEDPSKRASGWQSLQGLANNGNFVAVGAALSLSHLAGTDEERAQALTALEAIADRQPEQRELVQPEIDRLKG